MHEGGFLFAVRTPEGVRRRFTVRSCQRDFATYQGHPRWRFPFRFRFDFRALILFSAKQLNISLPLTPEDLALYDAYIFSLLHRLAGGG